MDKQNFRDAHKRFKDGNYQTLWEATQHIEEKYRVSFPMITGGIGYNENRRFTIDPNRDFSGVRPNSQKMLQVVITRLDNGLYEVVDYIL